MPDIVITPNRGTTSNPKIDFTGTSAGTIKLEVLADGTISWNGGSGSLFSIADSLSGSLMSVNDASGLPVFEVFSDNKIVAGPYNQNAFVITSTGSIGLGTASPTSKFTIQGSQSEIHIKHDSTRAIALGNWDGTSQWIKSINLGVALTPLTLQASRFTFDTGYVGIGTTNPQASLDVKSVGVNVYRATDTSNQYRWRVDQNFAMYLTAANGSDICGIEQSKSWFNQGNVGIGTNTPNHALQIGTSFGGTASQVSLFVNAGNQTYAGSILISPDGNESVGAKIGQYFESATNQQRLDLGTVGYSGVYPTLSVKDGSVGIGTTVPSSKLHILGSATASQGLLKVENNRSSSVYYPAASFINVRGDHSFGIVAEFRTNTSGDSDRPSILFYGAQAAHSWQVGQTTSNWGVADGFGIGYRASNAPSGYGAWPTAYFNIKTDGNVGIGDTSPNAKLTVDGTVGVGSGHKLSLIGLDINSGGTPSYIKIRTNIPSNSGGADFTVNIKGFRYGTGDTTNLMICWHWYNNIFYNATATSSGSWAPTIRLSAEGGYVSIVLTSPNYWPKLYVESMYSSYYNSSYASGWSWVDEDANGSAIVNVTYRINFGNNFSMSQGGNVSIGASYPYSKLWIEKIGIDEGAISIDDTASNSHLTLAGSDGRVRMHFGTYHNGNYGGWIQTSYDNDPYTSSNSGYEPLILNPQGGFVGIGTTSPSEKLAVSGTILATNGLVANAANDPSSFNGGLHLWSGTSSTTSTIMFKTWASIFGRTNTALTESNGYATYHIMDSVGRGWVWRYATSSTGGTNVASLRNDTGQMTLGTGYNWSSGYHAQLNISAGQGSATLYRDIDMHGSWAGGEGHAITATHGSGATDIVGQMVFYHDGTGSRIRFGKLYHGGNSTTLPIEIVSLDASSAYLSVNRDVYINGGAAGNYGNRLIIGNTSTPQTLQDGNFRPTAYIYGQYPVLTLDHTATGNSAHGPTIQFTFNGLTTGGSTGRQIVIGSTGDGAYLDVGFSGGGYGNNSNLNPHNGISGYNGLVPLRIFSTGILVGSTGAYGSHITSITSALDVRGKSILNYPTTLANSLTYGGDAGQIFRNEGSELAIGLLNASPYPLWIQGRTSGNGARDIVFQPSGGNVGIGTTSPSSKFVVNNNGGVNNAFYVDVGSYNGPTTLFEHTGTNSPVPFRLRKSGYSGASVNYGLLYLHMNDNTAQNAGALYFTLNDSAGNEHEYAGIAGIIRTNTNGAEAGDLFFMTSDAGTTRSEKMRIRSNGNVGIGIADATNKLHVLGSSNDTINVANTNVKIEGSGGNGLAFGTISSSPYSSYIQSGYVYNFATAVYNLALNPIGGNVAIGNTSATQKLHVYGAIRYRSNGSLDVTEYSGTVAGHDNWPTCDAKARIYTIGTVNSGSAYNGYIEVEVIGSHRGYTASNYREYKKWIFTIGDKISSRLQFQDGVDNRVGMWNGTDATGWNNHNASGAVLKLIVNPSCGSGYVYTVKIKYAEVSMTHGDFSYVDHSVQSVTIPYAQFRLVGGDVVLGQETGNVGVGNSSLAYKLDVSGDARITGAVKSSRFEDSGGSFLFRSGSQSGTTRHLNLSDSTTDPSGASSSSGITWGERTDSNPYYIIMTRLENWNSSGNYSKLELNWHTGIKIGASTTYGGTRFYNNSPGVGGSEIFSVGKGDSNVRVENNLFVSGSIGIGVTTTNYKLHVEGSAFAYTLTLPQNPVSTGYSSVSTQPTYYIGQTNGNDDGWKIYGESPSGGNTGNLILQSEDDYDGNESIRLRFKKTYSPYTTSDILVAKYNAVGIDTQIPSYKLDVNGDFRAANSAYFATVNGTVGIGTTNASYLLDVNGNVRIITSLGVGTAPSNTTGEIRATNNITAYYSDERLKTRVGKIEDPIGKIKTLSGFYFEANETAVALGYTKKREVGVSAQEVQAVMPEVVTAAPISDEYLTVRYERLIPLLIEAIKEQQKQIEDLKTQLNNLR